MVNFTLDVFWIDFMPVFEHVIGLITLILSLLAIWLLLSKTPESGKPLARYLVVIQLCILMNDFVYGCLFCPVLLYPLPAAICTGLICGSLEGFFAGFVLIYQCVQLVGLAIIYTLHYKYITIAQMTNIRKISTTEKIATRAFFFIMSEQLVAVLLLCWEDMYDLPEYLIGKEQVLLAELLDSDKSLQGAAYVTSKILWRSVTVVTSMGIEFAVTFVGGAFFVFRSLELLSVKSVSISEKTRKLQQRLMYMLLMQIGIPFAMQIGPIFIHFFSIIIFLFAPPMYKTFQAVITPGIMNFTLCIQLCHASSHTIFLIITTPRYRKEIARLFTCHLRTPAISPE